MDRKQTATKVKQKMGFIEKTKNSNLPFVIIAIVPTIAGLWNLFSERIILAFIFFMLAGFFSCTDLNKHLNKKK